MARFDAVGAQKIGALLLLHQPVNRTPCNGGQDQVIELSPWDEFDNEIATAVGTLRGRRDQVAAITISIQMHDLAELFGKHCMLLRPLFGDDCLRDHTCRFSVSRIAGLRQSENKITPCPWRLPGDLSAAFRLPLRETSCCATRAQGDARSRIIAASSADVDRCLASRAPRRQDDIAEG